MPIRDLKAQIARLPEQPGVYVYFNDADETLYVGKARVLRDRVRSYLGAHGTSPRIDALLDEAHRLEVIVTDSVMEALALENHLIKQRAPRYNILLRDDKNYPYLQLTTGEAFPRVLVARRVQRDDHYYAGPFLPASLGRRTMALTHRLFGIRSCNEVITGERGRPCLEFDIKRCIAPCVRTICSPEDYRVAVEHTQMFLEGRNDALVATLRDRMRDAAAAERFEQAAQLRDAIRTIDTLGTRQQKMSSAELGDRDAFGLKVGPAGASVQVFEVRHGRVVERIELVTDSGPAANSPPASREQDVLQAAVQQFYEDRVPPPEIHVPLDLAESDAARGMVVDQGRPPRPADRSQTRRKKGSAGSRRQERRARLSAALQREHCRQLRCARDAPRRPGVARSSAPDRVLRHLDDSGQRDRGVDGGLRRRTHAEGGVSEVPDPRPVGTVGVRDSRRPR